MSAAIPSFLRRHFLPFGLLLVAGVGLTWPEPGQAAGQLPIQYVAVALIFICSGLTLRTEEIAAAFATWPASLFGSSSILFITPIIIADLLFVLLLFLLLGGRPATFGGLSINKLTQPFEFFAHFPSPRNIKLVAD